MQSFEMERESSERFVWQLLFLLIFFSPNLYLFLFFFSSLNSPDTLSAAPLKPNDCMLPVQMVLSWSVVEPGLGVFLSRDNRSQTPPQRHGPGSLLQGRTKVRKVPSNLLRLFGSNFPH